MFNLKKYLDGLVSQDDEQSNAKTTNEIIQEIHDTFYTEVDRLLESAGILNSVETTKQDLILKSQKLRSLGFNKTKEVKKAQQEMDRISILSSENFNKKQLTDTIKYFSFKYPFYKFITEKSVRTICEKYNLVYSEVSNYIGEVPDDNLTEIEKFKIKEEDECYIQKETDFFSSYSRYEFISFKDYKQKSDEFKSLKYESYRDFSFSKCPLEICAPLKDFNLKDTEIKNFKLSKIEIPDPVVLKPVFYRGKKHYLIITAWGLEANDELVKNHNNN